MPMLSFLLLVSLISPAHAPLVVYLLLSSDVFHEITVVSSSCSVFGSYTVTLYFERHRLACLCWQSFILRDFPFPVKFYIMWFNLCPVLLVLDVLLFFGWEMPGFFCSHHIRESPTLLVYTSSVQPISMFSSYLLVVSSIRSRPLMS